MSWVSFDENLVDYGGLVEHREGPAVRRRDLTEGQLYPRPCFRGKSADVESHPAVNAASSYL